MTDADTVYTIHHDGLTVRTANADRAEYESRHGARVTAVTFA